MDRRGSIGIGVAVAVAVIVVGFLIFVESESENIRLAQVKTFHDADTDTLQVFVILTDSKGDYTKASGDANVTIEKDGYKVYSVRYFFDKNDFVTFTENSTGDKVTGYVITIQEFFPAGVHEVSVDLTTKSAYFEDLNSGFISLNPLN